MGTFEGDFQIVAACRDASIYILDRFASRYVLARKFPQPSLFGRGTTVVGTIELQAHAVGLARPEKSIVVGCLDHTLVGYSAKVRCVAVGVFCT
jgi:hypothetical protein